MTRTPANIYASLESISQDLLYYTSDSSIVDQLLDRLGYHYEDTVSFGAAGTFGDPSDEGFMTHPFKYVRLPASPFPPAFSWQTHPCFDETSAFSGYDIESLDINNADDRSVIEEAFYGLNHAFRMTSSPRSMTPWPTRRRAWSTRRTSTTAGKNSAPT